MRKVLVLLAGLLMAITVASPPAGAITGDYVEDNEHPFVGLVAFYDADGVYLQRCTGSLLSPTVFLTAGHCTSDGTGARDARVYFQQDAGADYDPRPRWTPPRATRSTARRGPSAPCAPPPTRSTTTAGRVRQPPRHQRRRPGHPRPADRDGRVRRAGGGGDARRPGHQRGQQDLTFTASGYGVTETNPVTLVTFRERLMAETRLTNLRSHLNDGFNVQTNGNGPGRGGTCSGDSGGPLFYGDSTSNLIVGVTSFGLSTWCRGVDFSFRTDRQAVLDWIRATVGDDAWSEIQVVG